MSTQIIHHEFIFDTNSARRNVQQFSDELDELKQKIEQITNRKFLPTTIPDALGETTRKVNEYNQAIERSRSSFEAEVSRLQKERQKLLDSATQFIADGEFGKYEEKLKNVNNRINELNTGLGKTTKTSSGFFSTFASGLARLVPFLAQLFLVDAATRFIGSLIEINKNFEVFTIKGQAALGGSIELLNRYDATLRRIDVKSPFDLEQLQEGFIKLANRRVQLTEQELTQIANVASALGTRGTQGFSQVVEALLDAQVGQFKRLEELGVGVDATGEKIKFTFAGTTTEVNKTGAAITQYVLNLDRANGAMNLSEKLSTSIAGRISSLQGAFQKLALSIGEDGRGGFGEFIEGITTSLTLSERLITKLNDITDNRFFSTALSISPATGSFMFLNAISGSNPQSPEERLIANQVDRLSGESNRRKFLLDEIKRIESDPKYIELTQRAQNNPRFAQRLLGESSDNSNLQAYKKELATIDKDILQKADSDVKRFIKAQSINRQTVVNERNKLFKELGIENVSIGSAFNSNTIRSLASSLDDKKLNATLAQLRKDVEIYRRFGVNEIKGDPSNAFSDLFTLESALINEADARRPTKNADGEAELKKAAQVAERLKSLELEKYKALLKIRIDAENEQLQLMEEGSNRRVQAELRLRRKELAIEAVETVEALKREFNRTTGSINSVNLFTESVKNSINSDDASSILNTDLFNGVSDEVKEIFKGRFEAITTEILTGSEQFDKKFSEDLKRRLSVIRQDFQAKFINPTRELSALFAETTADELIKVQNKYDELRKGASAYEKTILDGLQAVDEALIRTRQKQAERQRVNPVVQEVTETNSQFAVRSRAANLFNINKDAEEILAVYKAQITLTPELLLNPKFKQDYEEALKKVKESVGGLISNVNEKESKKKNRPLFDVLIEEIVGKDDLEANPELIGKFKNEVSVLVDSFRTVIQQYVSLQDQIIASRNQRINELQNSLEREEALQRAGLANNATLLRQQLNQEKSARDEAIRQKRAALKVQLAIDSAQRASTLANTIYQVVSENVKVFKVFGLISAGIQIAALFALIRNTTRQINSIPVARSGGSVRKLIGANGRVSGNSHEFGGSVIEAEADEYIVNRNSSVPNANFIENLNKLGRKIRTRADVDFLFSGSGYNPISEGKRHSMDAFNELQKMQSASVYGYMKVKDAIDGHEEYLRKISEYTDRIPSEVMYPLGDGSFIVIHADGSKEKRTYGK